jgi:hypothetical protein
MVVSRESGGLLARPRARCRRSGPVVAAAVALVVLGGAISGASATTGSAPSAHAAGTCGIGNSRGYGYTYVTAISVGGGAGCGQARGLIRAYHGRCGRGTGHCGAGGFACNQTHLNVIPTSYDAHVHCDRGGERVHFNYTQFT